MSFLMIFRIAFKALSRNKLRTALTMLGMIIGVGAVITMVALGTGAQTSIDAQIQSAGTNMLQVSAGHFAGRRRRRDRGAGRRAVRRRSIEHARTNCRWEPKLEHDRAGNGRRSAADSLL